MPPIKRPYRAKVKGEPSKARPRARLIVYHQGCHECSQRRVNCDRGTPECRKCIAKGLKCSGLGVRHRFSNGVASRGHYSGKTMDTAYPLEMIAIDGPHNGWRYLMLPMAESDELVMDAVLAISLFHSSGILHKDLVVDKAEQDHYGRAIQGLQKRSQLRYCDRSDQQSILITVLLLLTAVMVNGSSDFPILFGMLQSAIDAIGGEGELGSGEIAEFLVRQVHKLKVYAAPLLSEHAGIDVISSEAEVTQMFDCLNHCLQNNPRHSDALAIVPNLVRQACEIYMKQAVPGSRARAAPQIRARHAIASICRVQRFIDTLEAFPKDSPGKQVLTWACFIAASDCRLAEHKEFFSNFFLSRYATNGFMNLAMGLEALRKIWARNPDERWTVLLPQLQLFVM
ncbi:uncharacterized protein NECHADRAFT_56269 [Fusarium vanettenii 77-13-4]|uniref:Zn(2)-C6 fungal-type domain-containing protein n=1 Tax=Fusarium vanettenii (strain ATCC MYA-4622 / CBS 123669 / FGSC 9596 / NRRL 45880 / 77-13-4) TaxID=660122 RepID=C7ZQM8_FUSV7|nr:uncharacterized protein NECHADRAFT_56269 [Fusarium vanettenii 77-13-4]EEU33678.1 hypothetical protein NECHADRAFT_56269 [Fusarium vanettenii 77-13-4]